MRRGFFDLYWREVSPHDLPKRASSEAQGKDRDKHPMARLSAKNGRNGTTEVLRAVGKKLRLRRVERGFTLQAVSERTGVSAAMLSLVERGKASPSVGTLVAINSLLNLHIPELLMPLAITTWSHRLPSKPSSSRCAASSTASSPTTRLAACR